MDTKELQRLIEKIPTWPEEAQFEALEFLQSIEREVDEPYELTEADKASIERGLDDARNGRFVPEEKVRELLARYRKL